MEYHVSTLQPAIFVVPSRKWSFKVYLTAMPQMGWDVASTTYPYQLQMSIDEDLSGIKSRQIQAGVLERLYKGVGYNPHVHGGDAGAFNKLVKTVISASGGPGGGTSSGGGTGGITGGRAPGTSGINPNKGSLTMDEIAKLAAWAFGNETNMSSNDLVKNTIYATAVCIPESGGHVGSNNTAATNGTAYGLWQGNATNGVSIAELQTAEGNATWMAREVQADYALSQSDNPFALRTWEHAWWAYWGAFRTGAYKSHMSEARRATAKVF
jgi:hypothetical protein